MKATWIIGGLIGAIAVISVALALVAVAMYFSYSNKEIRLGTLGKAQQQSCEAVFDNTWKIISQKAQVADKYKEAFKDIYPQLMEGRYGNARGGALLSFVTESNPNFDIGLYKDLSAAIESQRSIFTREQQKLIDIKREHDNVRLTFPGSLFVGSRPEMKITVVTSGKTKEAFATGEENDVKL